MNWYDCKYCKDYKGDCGNHYKDGNGHINFEIADISYCNQYGTPDCFKDTRSKWDVRGKYKGEISLYECRAFNVNEAIMLAQECGFLQIDSAQMVRE